MSEALVEDGSREEGNVSFRSEHDEELESIDDLDDLDLCCAMFDRDTSTHRYLVYLLLCCFLPGPYFMESQLASYEELISNSDTGLGIDAEDFELLFALPAITGVLVGPMGVMIAKYGYENFSLASGILIFVSAMIVVSGLRQHRFYTMLLGRVLFWLGIYTLCAVQTKVAYTIFSGPALTVAYGLLIASARAGGILAFFFSGFILDWSNGNVAEALWYGEFFVGLAALSAILFASLRSKVALSLAMAVRPALSARLRLKTSVDTEETLPSQWHLQILSLKTWLVIVQIAIVYGVTFPLEIVLADFLEVEWGFSPTKAGIYSSLAPSFGLFSWVYGIFIKDLRSMLRGNILAWIAYVVSFMMIKFWGGRSPLLALVLFGVGYSYVSTISWVLIPKTLGVRQDCLMAAITVSYACMSMAIFSSNMVVGMLQDTFGFRAVIKWLFLASVAGFLCSVLLHEEARKDKFLWIVVEDDEHGNDDSDDQELMQEEQHDRSGNERCSDNDVEDAIPAE